MPQGNNTNRRSTIHWSTYLQEEQNELNKSICGLDWLQKSIRYGPVKLDNRISKCTRYPTKSWSHRRNHKKLVSGINSRKKKFTWDENPERYIPGRCTITITIGNSDDATQSNSKKTCRLLHTYKRSIVKCTWTSSNYLPKRIRNPITDSENIQSGYRDGIWQRKICATNNKWKTTNDRRNGTTNSRKKNWTLGEKESTWEYWMWRWKKKI